jgi:hypothetical protein
MAYSWVFRVYGFRVSYGSFSEVWKLEACQMFGKKISLSD